VDLPLANKNLVVNIVIPGSV